LWNPGSLLQIRLGPQDALWAKGATCQPSVVALTGMELATSSLPSIELFGIYAEAFG
jgi:hypothetical protein